MTNFGSWLSSTAVKGLGFGMLGPRDFARGWLYAFGAAGRNIDQTI